MKKINEKTKNSLQKKEKILAASSAVSGGLSFLGGWQVCHNLCLGIIALLSIIGITVAGMPLLFLTEYAVYFWSIAILVLIPTLIIYWKNRKCMSAKLILFNIGIVTAAVPFLQDYQFVFWTVGGVFILASISMFMKTKCS